MENYLLANLIDGEVEFLVEEGYNENELVEALLNVENYAAVIDTLGEEISYVDYEECLNKIIDSYFC